jgi:serine/threonine protein kinase
MLLASIARVLVKYGCNAAGFGLAGDAILEIWDLWNKSAQDAQQKRQEVERLAAQPTAEARQQAQAAVAQEAASLPDPQRQAVTAYLAQVPNAIRQSQRRPEDPSGRSVSARLSLRRAEDLRVILPPRLPRFKAGDHPPGVGDWELQELLGMGGFGEVWKARNPYMPDTVALKFCLDPEAAKVLRNEAVLLGRVQSEGRQGKLPQIVQLKHTYLSADPPCLEYEYIAGGDLAGLVYDLLRGHKGNLHPGLVRKLVSSLASTMQHPHQLNPPIVHRDLKPANILVERLPKGLQLHITDFGIGGVAAGQALEQAREASTGHFQATALRGAHTPLYASPQQVRGDPPDPRDDVFALGVIWYQMLAGDLSKGAPHGNGWMKPFREQGVAAAELDLLQSCFEDDPECRPADAGALAQRVEELQMPRHMEGQVTNETARPGPKLLTEKGGSTAPAASARAQPGQSAKRRLPRSWLVGGGLLALGTLVAAIVLFWQTPHGAVRIESDDPNVEVVFDRTGPTVKGADKEPIVLRAGEHGLLVKRGGFTFETANILIKKGEVLTLKVELLQGKMQVKVDGRVIGAGTLDMAAAKAKTGPEMAKEIKPIKAPGGEPKPERIGEMLRIDLFEGGLWLNPQAFSINSDGRRAVCCKAKGLELIDLDTGETVKQLMLKMRVTPNDAIPQAPSFLPRDRELLLGFIGGAIEVLNLDTGIRRVVVEASESKLDTKAIPSLVVTRDGRAVFACGNDNIVRQFDTAAGKELARTGSLDFAPTFLSPSADGRRALMLGDGAKRAYIWNVGRQARLRSLAIPNNEDESYEQVVLSADGHRAVLSRGYTRLRHTLYVWDVDADLEIRQIELPQVCRQLAFTPDGKTLLAASSGYLPNASAKAPMSRVRGTSTLWLLDLETGKTLHQFDGHSNQGIVYLGVATNGRRAITVGNDRTMRVWGLPARCRPPGAG